MANEIKIIQQIAVNNGNLQLPNAAGGKLGQSNQTPTQTTPNAAMPTVSAIIAANGTLLNLATLSPAIAIGGWVMFQNIDPTNFVEWGPDDGAGALVKAGKMLPGEYAGPFRADNLKFRFQADTAPCIVQAILLAP